MTAKKKPVTKAENTKTTRSTSKGANRRPNNPIDSMERKRMQQASSKSEERYKIIFESSPLAINITHEEEITYANPAYLKMFGFPNLAELLSYAPLELFTPEYRLQIQKNIQRRAKGLPAPDSYEVECFRKDGTRFPVLMYLTRTTFADGPATVGFILDTTERKQAEEALRAVSSRQEAILAAVPDIIMEVNNNKVYTWANQAGLAFFGEDVVGKEAAFYFEGEQKTYDLVQPLFNGDESVVYLESWQRNKEGQKRLLAWWCRALKDESGNVIGALSSGRDITERKQAEEALRESEERYKNLFQNNHAAMLIIDPDSGTIVDANPAAATYYGWNHKELLKKNIDEINTLTTEEVHAEMQLSRTEKRNHFIFKHRRADGSIRDVEVYSGPLALKGKSLLYSIVHDLTERKQSEEALRESEERFYRLSSATSEGIVISDQGKIVDANPQIVSMLGYDPDEMIGLRPINFVAPESRDLVNANIRAGIEGPYEHLAMKKDGSVFPVEICARSIHYEGHQARVTIIRDITERKQAEAEVRKRHEDLTLLNAINAAANHGESLAAIINLISENVKGLFSSMGATIHLFNADHSRLVMQNMALDVGTIGIIEKILGLTLPAIEHDLQKAHPFRQVLESRQAQLVTDPRLIQDMFVGYIEAVPLGVKVSTRIKKLLPTLVKIIGQKSVMIVPLITGEEIIGTLDVGSREVFSEDDLRRLEIIAEQLTSVIQRKRAEEKLEEERILLRTLIDNLPDRVYVMDVQGRKVLSNIADWQACGGKTMEDVIGKTDLDTYPSELAESYWALDKSVIESGESMLNLEEPGLDPQGKRVWVLSSKVPLRDNQGKVIGLVGVGRDITERKWSEEQLSYQAALLANVNDAIVASDSQFRLTAFNAAAEALYGWKAEEVLGRNGLEIFRTEWSSVDADDMRRRIAEMGHWRGEATQVLKDGTRIPVEMSSIVLRDKSGQITGYISMNRDITERKQTQTLQEAVYQIAAAAETTSTLNELYPQIHQIISSVMPAEYFYITLYDEAQDLLRFPYFKDAADEPSVDGIQPGKGLTAYVLRTGKSLLCTQAVHDELERKGEVKLLGVPSAIWLGVPLVVEGKTIGAMVVQHFTDPRAYGEREQHMLEFVSTQVAIAISRKQVEEQIRQLNTSLEQRVEERTRELRQAQEQLVRKEKLATLGQLAGGVGHELRNPLGVINTSIYYLKLVQPEASEKIKEHHAMIEQEVHNAEKIINDLLDFARVISAEREQVSVDKLVRRTLERFPVPPAVKLKLELPDDIPNVYADPRQVEQVLGNLVTNACQAMNLEGKLTISARRQKKMVGIAVKDTGSGISPENMKKLFEPLFTTKVKGIGLGLAVSQKLAEANGGLIEVKSEVGTGSTFKLYLPIQRTVSREKRIGSSRQ